MPRSVRFPKDVEEAMQELAERDRRSFAMEVIIACEEYLAKHGLWPPTDDDDS
jgi:hypothetical protein